MAIPFPPGGPQVQAALQNPARFPDQRLQEYAQGQQPTGQVPPPMAANELTIRNAQRQAASRQSAMQNNPQNSPTVFQQKDMELQQKAQQLAAMQQQMQQQMQQREQQTQQKEQQLGVIGALMAKKAQDLQAREAMGVAQLPVNPDMFTAMHGGIVFNGGGRVPGYASSGLVGRYTPIKTPLEEMGFKQTEEPSTEEDYVNTFEENTRQRLRELESAEANARFSPEEKARRLEEAEKKYAGQYEKYKKGIGGLDEETAAAIRGKPTGMLQKLAAGLPTDTRGMRLGTGIASIAKGYMGEVAKEESREQEAAKYLAEAKRKQAAADFAEERNQPELAKKLVDSAEADLAKVFDIRKGVITAQIGAEEKIGTMRQRQELGEEKVKSAERLADERRRSAEKIADLRDAAFRDRTQAMLDIAKVRAEINAAGGGNQLSLLTNIKLGRLRELNNKKPKEEQLSEAMLRDMAADEAVGDLYGARNEAARASAVRAAVTNAKSQAEALSKLQFQKDYIEASPEEQANMKREILNTFPSTGGGVSALPLPNASKGSTPPPPPGFVPNSR